MREKDYLKDNCKRILSLDGKGLQRLFDRTSITFDAILQHLGDNDKKLTWLKGLSFIVTPANRSPLYQQLKDAVLLQDILPELIGAVVKQSTMGADLAFLSYLTALLKAPISDLSLVEGSQLLRALCIHPYRSILEEHGFALLRSATHEQIFSSVDGNNSVFGTLYAYEAFRGEMLNRLYYLLKSSEGRAVLYADNAKLLRRLPIDVFTPKVLVHLLQDLDVEKTLQAFLREEDSLLMNVLLAPYHDTLQLNVSVRYNDYDDPCGLSQPHDIASPFLLLSKSVFGRWFLWIATTPLLDKVTPKAFAEDESA